MNEQSMIEPLELEIEGHKATIEAFYEDEPIDVAFETEEENEAYIKRFEKSELLNVRIDVTITDEHGADGFTSLGHCHINACDPLNGIQDIVSSHGMLEEALFGVNVDKLKGRPIFLTPYDESESYRIPKRLILKHIACSPIDPSGSDVLDQLKKIL